MWCVSFARTLAQPSNVCSHHTIRLVSCLRQISAPTTGKNPCAAIHWCSFKRCPTKSSTNVPHVLQATPNTSVQLTVPAVRCHHVLLEQPWTTEPMVKEVAQAKEAPAIVTTLTLLRVAVTTRCSSAVLQEGQRLAQLHSRCRASRWHASGNEGGHTTLPLELDGSLRAAAAKISFGKS